MAKEEEKKVEEAKLKEEAKEEKKGKEAKAEKKKDKKVKAEKKKKKKDKKAKAEKKKDKKVKAEKKKKKNDKKAKAEIKKPFAHELKPRPLVLLLSKDRKSKTISFCDWTARFKSARKSYPKRFSVPPIRFPWKKPDISMKKEQRC